jgi:hypothetical protein
MWAESSAILAGMGLLICANHIQVTILKLDNRMQTFLDGCAECFCFGVTDKCRSSFFPVQTFSFDDQAWKTNDTNGKVRGEGGRVYYEADPDNLPSYDVYLDAPIAWKNDYTTSYGLHIYFVVTSVTNDEKRVSSTAADVKLISDDTVLDFWTTQQVIVCLKSSA